MLYPHQQGWILSSQNIWNVCADNIMIVLCIAGGESSSAESALPWVLIEEGTSKQLSSEERFVSQSDNAHVSVYQLQYGIPLY